MASRTIYEWRIDALDSEGDVIELFTADAFEDLPTENQINYLEGYHRTSAPYLTRRRYFVDIECNYWDLECEQEAYLDDEFDGKLNGGASIPKRFHKYFTPNLQKGESTQ